MVKPTSDRIYEIWVSLAFELLEMGEISNCKYLLKESLEHCKLLKDSCTMDRCYLGLTRVYLIEGEMVEAVNMIVVCNKMCRDVKQWQTVYETLFEVLLVVNKFDELRAFSDSLNTTIERLIEDILKSKRQNTVNHEHELLELKHLLNTSKILNIELAVKEYVDSRGAEGAEDLIKALASAESEELVNEGNALLSTQHESLLRIFSEIMTYIEEGVIEPQFPLVSISLVQNLIKVLSKVESQLMNSQRYNLVGVSEACFRMCNPMVNTQQRVRISISRAHNIEGILKKINRISLLQRQLSPQQSSSEYTETQ